MPSCTNCKFQQIVKNGHIHNGKQRFKCCECGKQFVEQPQKKMIANSTRELIERLLQERISLAGIARATQVSQRWLQTYVNQKYAAVRLKVCRYHPKKGKINDSVR